MGLLDDAIREHLELKRQHGADPAEVERQEREALGAAGRAEEPAPEASPAGAVAAAEVLDEVEPGVPEEPSAEEPAGAPGYDQDPWVEEEPAAGAATEEHSAHPAEPDEEDVLEETPDFLQETPEHDRLWFEQKPPRDFDWDR